MLTTIMKMQKTFQERLGVDFEGMSAEERAKFMRDQRGYLEDEVAEALYEMPFYKTWKNYDKLSETERAEAWEKVRMELVDAAHFFINLLLGAGFTPEQFYNMYVKKNLENHRRQDAGYEANVSYRDQAVEDVMQAPQCMISMDGINEVASDFIAILEKPDGTTSLRYFTDPLSMGLAVKLLASAYRDMLKECTPEEQTEIRSIVGEFCYESKDEEAVHA